MNIKNQLPKLFVLGFFGLGAVMLISKNFPSSPDTAVKTNAVAVPAVMSPQARKGEALFSANCATCHRDNASGTDKGPPLIHDIYNPGHHSDEAFYLAAANGVRQHHWPYGGMPPQPHVKREDMVKIIQYVRELQVENGITYRPHNM